MPRPLAALAALFALVIVIAAILLYRADFRQVQEASQSPATATSQEAQPAEETAAAPEVTQPAAEAAAPSATASDEQTVAVAPAPPAGEGSGAAAEGASAADEEDMAAAETPAMATGEASEAEEPAAAAERQVAAMEPSAIGEASGAASEGTAPTGERQAASTTPPGVGDGSGAASEGGTNADEGMGAAAETPAAGDASGAAAEVGVAAGEEAVAATETPAAGEVSGATPEEGAATDEGMVAAAETPAAGGVSGATSEESAAGEETVAAAETPAAGEASGPTTEGGAAEEQVATADEPVKIEAMGATASDGQETVEAEAASPEQRIELGPVEATAPTEEGAPAPVASAEATAPDFANHLEVAAVQGQAEGVAVSVEAAPGAIDTGKVTIRAAEAEAGSLYVAGAAPPGTLIRVYLNENLVGETRASQDGSWLIEAKRDVPVGEVVFRVEAVPEAGAGEAPVIEASAPFMRYSDGVVLEPVVTAATSEQALASDGAVPRPTYVIIRRGDNLWRIARRNYGRGIKYQAIFAANRDSIENPHWIFPGQVFVIPTRDRTWDTTVTN